jgi:hypothetical protein
MKPFGLILAAAFTTLLVAQEQATYVDQAKVRRHRFAPHRTWPVEVRNPSMTTW